MRTWLVLAAVLAVAAAAAADALRGGLRDRGQAAAAQAERRIVPPGVPAGSMGTVFYSDPSEGCRLRSLRLAGFTEAQPPSYDECRFSLSPDGTKAAPEGSVWSPLGGVVAVPREDGFSLEAGPEQTIVVRGRAPAFKPDGTLTQVRDGKLVEWSIDCEPGERLFTLPADNATARCAHIVYPHPLASTVWFSATRFAAISRASRLLIVDDGRVVVRTHLLPYRTAALSISPRRTFVSIWIDGDLAGTFDAKGGPVVMPPLAGVHALAWSPTERGALLATERGGVYLFRPATGDARVRRLDISARDVAWR
jgi:hypothetical protein